MSEKTNKQKQVEYISNLMKENHEFRQVCFEVLNCLENLDAPLKIVHCKSELNRVLFSPNDFLH